MQDTPNNLPDRADAGGLVPAARGRPVPRDAYYGQLGPYGVGPHDDFAEPGFNLREYLSILNRRKGLIAGIVVAFLALGAVWTLMQTPLYTATARLQIDRNVTKIVEGGSVNPVESSDADFLRTQYELLRSRALAERVVAVLRLADDETFLRSRGFSFVGFLGQLLNARPPEDEGESRIAELKKAAVSTILDNRTIRPVPGSRLVDILYADPNPSRARQIAAAYAEAFVESNLDKRFEANAYAKTFLEEQLKQLKVRLESAEKAAVDFAEKEQIVVLTEKASLADSNLAAAQAALAAQVAERIKNQELWTQVENADAINIPQLLFNSVIDGLRAKRNALVAEYQEKLEIYKPGYPSMVQIKNKIAEVDRQLATEVKTLKASYKAAYESSLNQEAEMLKRIEALKAEALDLQQRSIQYNILKREADTTRSLYDNLLQRYKEVEVAGGASANNVFIVDKPETPRSPSSPVLSKALLLCFVLGLGLGVSTAFLIERLDDTIRTPDQLTMETGLATLGIIPKISGGETTEGELADPRSALSEAYRSLCTSLQFATESGLPKTLVVTSTGPSEGKSITSVAIARHFATMGLKVLLIDADLRNPSLHIKLGLDNTIGLANYLTGACTPPETFQATPIVNLAFMPSGPLPPNAADLLAGTRLHSLLSTGLEVFDLIVIDGPPVVGLADAPLLSSVAAATVFVVGAGQARRGSARGALSRLQFARGPIVGAVLTKYDSRHAGYGDSYGYSSGYGYGYGYGAQAQQSLPRSAQPGQTSG